MKNQLSNNDKLKDQIEQYISHWKWFLISGFLFVFLAFLYVRYTTETYKISATIKIANANGDHGMLSEANELNNYGLFSRESNSVKDEIEILKSRSLIKKVVEDLKLNIQIFKHGKIQTSEIYKNPPLFINFLSNDSIIKKIDTTLTLHVSSDSDYIFDKTSKKLSFGDKVSTSFGNFIITPNVNSINSIVDSDVSIKITSLENKINYYNDNIKISQASEESSIIHISLLDPLPKKGIEILDNLIEEYNNQIVENKNKIVNTTSDFINNRLQVVSSELSQVDLTAETIKQDNRLTDLSTQSNIYLQSERDIESQQIATSTQLQLIDYMDNYLKENSSNSDLIPENMSFEDNAINELTQQHNELVVQRNRILKNSSEINPVVINLDEQIKSLKQGLNASLNNFKSSNLIRLEALNKEDSRISSKIYSAPRKERQFRDLNRQQGIKESLYLYLLQKREESAITHGVSSPNAIIIDNAYSSQNPVAPKKNIIFLLSLFFGMLIPAGAIYTLDLMDTKIHNAKEIKNLSPIPFLGDIPKSKTKETIVQKVDYSPLAEAFRLVRTNIDFMLSKIPKDQGKVIFVTSTTSQEGKSHTSVNLSKSLSYSNKKVLLIETDIRVPKANKYLKVENKIGLTNFLVDDSIKLNEVIQKLDNNMHVIPSGTIPPNPAELLMSEKMDTLFKTVKTEYDYIIVDTAAVGLVTDTLIISKFADLVVYVVRANYLDRRQLNVSETMYTEKRLPNMAILLNGVKSKKGYGYGYGNSPKKSKSKR